MDDGDETLAVLYASARKRKKIHRQADYSPSTVPKKKPSGSNLDDDNAATLAELLSRTRKRKKSHEPADHSPGTVPNKNPSDSNAGHDHTMTLVEKREKSHQRADHNPGFVPEKKPSNSNSNLDARDCGRSEVVEFIKPYPKRSNFCPPRDGFRPGDFVWAKAFPYLWWPGFLDRIEGSSALIAFFGCQKTRWFSVSKIRGFEEGFHQISKMVGMKAKKAIDLALEELSRRTVVGLMYCHRALMSVEEKEVGERFEPNEMLGFVLDLAVSAQVGREDTARMVRLSAQVYAWRHLVSVCQNSRADDEFDSASFLESACVVARSPDAGNEDIACISKMVNQLMQNRRFISESPQWMYRTHDVEYELSSDESEESGGQEMSVSSSVNEEVGRKSMDTEDEVYICSPELDFDIAEQPVPEGRERCMLNREDIGFLDIDNESDSLLQHQQEVVAEQSTLIEQGIHMDRAFDTQNSWTGKLTEKVDAETTNILNSGEGHFNNSIDKGSRFCVDEGSITDSPCCKANSFCEHVAAIVNADCVALGAVVARESVSATRLENNDDDVHVKHENGHSNDTYWPETAPCAARQLTIDAHSIPQSSTDATTVVRDVGCTRAANKLGSLTMINDLHRKVLCDQPLKNFFKLHKPLVAHPEAMSYASWFLKYASSVGYESRSYDEIVADVTKKASSTVDHDNTVKLQSENKHGHPSNTVVGKPDNKENRHSLTLPNCTSFHHKRHQPIVPDLSKLRTNKPSVNKRSRFPKSLHMKFPKGFTIPSKEDIENKFRVLGPLDCSRTKVFSYTGAALVVFLHQADAYAAYKYVKKRNIFRHVNVRFWVDRHENHRTRTNKPDDHGKWKESLQASDANSSPVLKLKASHEGTENMVSPVGTQNLQSPALMHTLNLKSCLKRAEDQHRREEEKKTGKVRFLIETT